MQSPCLGESPQVCLQGCCPNPIPCLDDHKKPIPKSRNTSSSSKHDFATKTTSSFFPNTAFTNHESLPSPQESLSQFFKTYPQFSDTTRIDQIREKEYIHLSQSNHVCLDYIGIGLFSSPENSNFPFFNVSHKSVNLKSELLHGGGGGSEFELAIKKRIMAFLNISENYYSMVFTANRSSAFKLVSESYPFKSSKRLLTVYDYQSEAVDSMVSVSERRGAKIMSAEFKWPRLRIHSIKLRKMIVRNKKQNNKNTGLFVFPLQSRMTGANYSYQWMNKAQENGWHVLLDACALRPKDLGSFGLSLFHPDFLVCSFYKVFGQNPTGFGCLFVKKSIIPTLEASDGTGVVTLIEAEIQRPSRFECRGLDHVDSLGLMRTSTRTRCLINWLVTSLMKLKHPSTENTTALVRIYGPKVKFDRGPALAFNVYDWKGEKIEPALVQKLADRSNISLSHGFLHQIWFSEKYKEEKETVLERRRGEEKIHKKSNQGIAVVTAALGFLVNFEDIYRLWSFVARFLDADFVEKERWRYTALNQKTIEV